MKRLLLILLGMVIILLFVLFSFNTELISKPSTILYCYKEYSNELYCSDYPKDCDCFTITYEDNQ